MVRSSEEVRELGKEERRVWYSTMREVFSVGDWVRELPRDPG